MHIQQLCALLLAAALAGAPGCSTADTNAAPYNTASQWIETVDTTRMDGKDPRTNQTVTGLNADGQPVTVYQPDADGGWYRCKQWTYHANGAPQSERTYNADGVQQYETIFDEHGSRMDLHMPDAGISVHNVYTYDADGRVVTRDVFQNGAAAPDATYTYAYTEHANGGWTAECTSPDAAADGTLVSRDRYDAQGRLLESRSLVNGAETTRTTYTYDDQGRLTEQVLTRNGQETDRTTIQYDVDGLLRRETQVSQSDAVNLTMYLVSEVRAISGPPV